MKDELQKIYDKLNKIPEAERKEISHKFKQAGSLMREARLDYGLTLKELCLLISDNSITPQVHSHYERDITNLFKFKK